MGAFGCSVDEFIKTQVVLLLVYNRDENYFFSHTIRIHVHLRLFQIC